MSEQRPGDPSFGAWEPPQSPSPVPSPQAPPPPVEPVFTPPPATPTVFPPPVSQQPVPHPPAPSPPVQPMDVLGPPPGATQYGQTAQGGVFPAYPGAPGVQLVNHGRELASWGRRLGATLLDGLLIFAVTFPVAMWFFASADPATIAEPLSPTTELLLNVGSFVLTLLYSGVFQGVNKGRTLGKMALGIQVCRADSGDPVGVGGSVGRFFAHILDAIPCYLGYLWPLWDRENRTWADMICNHRVYRT